MFTLYWEKLSGSIAPHLMLEEIGAEYTLQYIDMGKKEHRGAVYRAICPSMRIPALAIPGGGTIGETGAITLYLGERFPQSGLVPMPGDSDRPEFLFWLMHMATQGYPTFSRAWHPEQFTDDAAAEDGIRQIGEKNLEDLFDSLEAGVSGEPYFLPRGFTALDIYLTMLTLWMPDRPRLFATRPRLGELCAAVEARASYREVARFHGLIPEDTSAVA